jgi:hypothetical protein
MDSAGKQAADKFLQADPDGGAGNPKLIRQAAKIAADLGDTKYAAELRDDARAWDRYLVSLAKQMREGRR